MREDRTCPPTPRLPAKVPTFRARRTLRCQRATGWKVEAVAMAPAARQRRRLADDVDGVASVAEMSAASHGKTPPPSR